MSTVKITIKDGGKVDVRVEGIPGKDCSVETAEIEKVLGKRVKDVKTSEYFKTQEVKAKSYIKAQNG
jgi:hypothetical protein